MLLVVFSFGRSLVLLVYSPSSLPSLHRAFSLRTRSEYLLCPMSYASYAYILYQLTRFRALVRYRILSCSFPSHTDSRAFAPSLDQTSHTHPRASLCRFSLLPSPSLSDTVSPLARLVFGLSLAIATPPLSRFWPLLLFSLYPPDRSEVRRT